MDFTSLFKLKVKMVVLEINWNELVLSIPAHQFLKMIFSFLDQFCCSSDHVPTVMSKSKSCRPLRAISAAAQHLVYTNESSIQRYDQSVFVVSWELPSSSIKYPFSTGSPKESSISCSFWTNVQWECVFSPIQTASGLPMAPKNEFAELSYVCSQPPCHPIELQSLFPFIMPQPSFHLSTPSITKPRIVSGTRLAIS